MASLTALRARAFCAKPATRFFSLSAARWNSENSSKPPRPIEDSTSALDYKFSQRTRPPPLPATDIPRPRSAEEEVTNILYNTPAPSLEPFKKHILNCLVQNEPGVLARVSGALAARGFNIDSLVVCRTEIRDLSRMCIVLSGQDGVVEQARRQLEDLVPVWAVLNYTDTRVISRELLLAKISILGPEYLEDQLAGGPSHDPRVGSQQTSQEVDPEHEPSKLEREVALAQNFAHSGQRPAPHSSSSSTTPDTHTHHHSPPPLTASEALRRKHQHLQSIATLSKQFGAKIVDVSENSVIVEMSGKTSRVEAFLNLVRPFGMLESARTGLMVMPRTPINAAEDADADDMVQNITAIDASLLPPG